MEIDIREPRQGFVEVIKFSDSDSLNYDCKIFFSIESSNYERDHRVYFKDVDNMIKALKKAKELWGDGDAED